MKYLAAVHPELDEGQAKSQERSLPLKSCSRQLPRMKKGRSIACLSESGLMLTKLSRETLAEQAAQNLIAFIESQDLKPGKLLPSEYQLAADLGVSRPIIREALKSLEGKGIVEVVSGKGAMVKLPNSQPLQIFFQRTM